jgi:hypothetical protein
MPLSWNEIRDRAFAFSKTWADAHDESSHAKPFWIDFFEIFGITDKRVATFEHAVLKFGGARGRADLFWRGKLLIEQKSLGKDLDAAHDQAMDYLDGIAERDLPRLVIVCDFAPRCLDPILVRAVRWEPLFVGDMRNARFDQCPARPF